MDKLKAMTRFTVVAQTGSFSQAAEQLGLPKSSVSSAVQSLEKLLGTRLFQRSTRRVTLTAEGEQYLTFCLSILNKIEHQEHQFIQDDSAIRGVLRIDMPSRFAANVVLPHLADWYQRYPLVTVKLSSNDQRADLIKERIDCVIRVGKLEDSSLIARHLMDFTVINCVSPDYIATYGKPASLAELSQHQLIDYAQNMQTQPALFEYQQQQDIHTLPMPSRLVVNSTDAYLYACISGLGIAQLPALNAQSYLAKGELIEILPQYRAQPMSVSLLYPSRRQVSKRLSLFMNWLDTLVKRLVLPE